MDDDTGIIVNECERDEILPTSVSPRDLDFAKHITISQGSGDPTENLTGHYHIVYPELDFESLGTIDAFPNVIAQFWNIRVDITNISAVWCDPGKPFSQQLTTCSPYDFLVHLCRSLYNRNVTKCHLLRLANPGDDKIYYDVVFSHTPEAERYYIKLWMDVLGSYRTAFDV